LAIKPCPVFCDAIADHDRRMYATSLTFDVSGYGNRTEKASLMANTKIPSGGQIASLASFTAPTVLSGATLLPGEACNRRGFSALPFGPTPKFHIRSRTHIAPYTVRD